MDGYSSDLSRYIIVTGLKHIKVSVTLTPFQGHSLYVGYLVNQWMDSLRVVLGWAYRGLTGGFLLLQNFSVAISVSPHVCFILVLIFISMFLR